MLSGIPEAKHGFNIRQPKDTARAGFRSCCPHHFLPRTLASRHMGRMHTGLHIQQEITHEPAGSKGAGAYLTILLQASQHQRRIILAAMASAALVGGMLLILPQAFVNPSIGFCFFGGGGIWGLLFLYPMRVFGVHQVLGPCDYAEAARTGYRAGGHRAALIAQKR